MTPAAPGHARAAWIAAGFALLLVWSARGTGVDPGTLLSRESAGQIAGYVVRLFPPDVSFEALREAGIGAVETFAISLLGSLLAVAIAVPLSLGAARTLLGSGVLFERSPPRGARRALALAVRGLVKSVLNLLRTIPELVWALFFVFLVGLGPFAGVLALGFHTAGVLGKLFGEVLEDVDSRPLEALQSTGAGRLSILVYGILPQAAPQFLSYALYRWEVNIRAAAILGFVGAGGLGQRVHIAISLFLDHRLLTLILAIYVLVTLVDALSAWLRSRLV